MKEIKVRAWDVTNGRWAVADDIEFDTLNGYDLILRAPEGFDLELFSGQLDKNGTEIHGGDIIRWDHKAHGNDKGVDIVEFTNGGFSVGGYPLQSFMYFKQIGTSVEVIGNIHQNPELVK